MGASAALGGALLSSRLGRSATREAWIQDYLAGSIGAALDTRSAVYYSLAKARTVEDSKRIDWRPWDAALHRLELTADPDLVAAAIRVDESMRRLRNAKWETGWVEDWGSYSDEIHARTIDFTNEARRALGVDGSLSRLNARSWNGPERETQ